MVGVVALGAVSGVFGSGEGVVSEVMMSFVSKKSVCASAIGRYCSTRVDASLTSPQCSGGEYPDR